MKIKEGKKIIIFVLHELSPISRSIHLPSLSYLSFFHLHVLIIGFFTIPHIHPSLLSLSPYLCAPGAALPLLPTLLPFPVVSWISRI
jgi:hypothetical protein